METNTIFERWNRNQLNVTYGVNRRRGKLFTRSHLEYIS